MNKNVFLRKAVVIFIAMLFSIGGIQAQCDHTDDLISLIGKDAWMQPQTSLNGWMIENGNLYDDGPIMYTGLSGRTGKTGVLKSPVFSKGCQSLSFMWDNGDNYTATIHFKIELLQGAEVVWSDEIFQERVVSYEPYPALFEDINIKGEVQLVITNLCPSAKDDYLFRDLFDVWDFCITEYDVEAIIPASNVITLDLSQSTNPETFALNENDVWTDTYNYKDYPFIEFGPMAFSHKNSVLEIWAAMEEKYPDLDMGDMMIETMGMDDGYWDGFTLSTNGDNSEQSNWITNQWGNMAGGGIKTDADGNVLTRNGVVLTDPNAPYLLGYVADVSWVASMTGPIMLSPVAQTVLYDAYEAVGVYVNASPWAYYVAQNGDGYARALDQDGDYFKLIIHGLDENYEDNGRAVEYYLAKNEGGTLIQSTDWEYVDLSSLGEVYGFYYTMETTDDNNATPTYFCMDKLQLKPALPAHNYEITAPQDATVYVGDKDQGVDVENNYLTKHYVPFTEQEAVYVATEGENKVWYYNLPAPKNAAGGFNYRITRTGKAPLVGTFKPSTVAGRVDTARVFTEVQLSARNATDIDHDVNSLAGRNVADVFININAQGFLTLPLGTDTTFQLIHTRNWQAIDTDVNNYFIEPDFHYTVVNENGEADNSVVSISSSGVITPVGQGTAIVLVTYDAMQCFHTTNVGITAAELKENPAFFSALWPENTGVFVVSVGNDEAEIESNMLINQYWSELDANGNDKVEATRIDAEHDVLYYEASKGSFAYTFTPEGVAEVLVATPAIGANSTSYSGFSADSVIVNTDGSYTVKVTFGRNIVKLISEDGNAIYQVITAKPVTWTVSNLTNPASTIFSAGDEVSVVFNTLYHPSNKMSGIYNMSAGIQYTGEEVNFPLILGPGQYTFASRAQEYKMTIPAAFEGEEYVLSNGVLKVRGFGSYYGQHRNITLQNGVNPNLNASVRTAYFGALPEITLRLTENPSAPSIEAEIVDETNIVFTWTASKDNGTIEGYNVYVNGELAETTTATTYTVENVEDGIVYKIEVEAIDNNGNKSEKATLSIALDDETAPSDPADLAGFPAKTTIALTWTASTDNVGVAKYNIYVNGTLVGNSTRTSYTLLDLTANTPYYIEVEAIDGMGNVSEKVSVTVTTTGDNTGFDEITAETISVYPNPFADYIIVNAVAASTATIYNVSGTAVVQTNIQSGANRIETSTLSKGVYVLKVGDTMVKIVK